MQIRGVMIHMNCDTPYLRYQKRQIHICSKMRYTVYGRNCSIIRRLDEKRRIRLRLRRKRRMP